MKIFVSADIEGVTGVTHWDETDAAKGDYRPAAEQMTAEVAAACEAALEAGATELWVKDAHDSARNLIADRLPRAARLVRGWSAHPFMMAQELDRTFAAMLLVGYHAGAATGQSPLAHTLTGTITRIFINGEPASEFLIQAHLGAYLGVPVVFLSGDQGICDSARAYNARIETVAVKQGAGGSTINLHPALAVDQIRAGVSRALQGDLSRCLSPLPAHFTLDVAYRDAAKAYQYGFYPTARLIDPVTVRFESTDYFEVLRFLLFVA